MACKLEARVQSNLFIYYLLCRVDQHHNWSGLLSQAEFPLALELTMWPTDVSMMGTEKMV